MLNRDDIRMKCRQTANHLKVESPAQVLGKRITENVTNYRKFSSFFKRHYDNEILPCDLLLRKILSLVISV